MQGWRPTAISTLVPLWLGGCVVPTSPSPGPEVGGKSGSPWTNDLPPRQAWCPRPAASHQRGANHPRQFPLGGCREMKQTEIQVHHHHVHRRATSSLPANSGCCTPDRESPSPNTPTLDKRIQRTATTTQARGEREWETKTSKEEHTEQGRVNACQEIRRSHASKWPTLGPHQSLLRRRQPDHQVAFKELALNS